MSVSAKTEVAALRRDVCFAPVSGHRQAASACLKSANNGLMHRNKQPRYSITSSARASNLDQSLFLRCGDASAVGLPMFG
jgi:hypothetical protein